MAEPAGHDRLRSLRHELRTPINHILGFAELLLEEADDAGTTWTEDIHRIHQAGQHVLSLVNDAIGAWQAGNAPADIAGVSHELRTSLTVVIGYSDLLQEEAPELGQEAALADLAKIHDAATRLLSLINAALELDLSQTEVQPNAEGAAPDCEAPAAEGVPNPAEPMIGTILVADDDGQNRELLSRRLARLGHTVLAAADGREALDVLRAEPVDLLLLDVMMPELDGFAVLARLKRDPMLRELPVIVLSALDEVATAVRCIKLGADDYLTKPFDPVLLQARINASLERKRLRDRELAYLRQAARVTGPAVIGQLLAGLTALTPPTPPLPMLGEGGLLPSPSIGRGSAAGRGEGGPAAEDQEAALRTELERAVEWVSLGKGEPLFQAGDPGDCFYVVLAGRLELIDPAEPEPTRITGEVRRGETLGELEMLTGKPRLVTAVAARDARLARIDQTSFDRLTETYPRILTRTSRDVVERLRDAFQRRPAAESVTAIAVLPLNSEVPRRDLTAQLSAALAEYGPTLHLNPDRLPDVLGHDVAEMLRDGGEHERLSAWLSELELGYRFVVYEADPQAPAWTRRCLRQADRVLLLGSGQAGPSAAPVVDQLAALSPATPVDLALLHDEARPRGTSEWLSRWRSGRHHHLRRHRAEDVHRLARLLAGRGVALVLSGGGARGWAHVGVIRALGEAGIPVDLIGGTSMGALIGGFAALGLSYQEIVEVARTYSPPRALFDYTLPLASLFTGQKLLRMLRDVFSDAQIEDLWRPYFCVSSSLTRAQPMVHRRGPLWQAVRASIAVAGVWTPIIHDGDLLADGSYLNNLPVDIMRGLSGQGTIVAVNANPAKEALGDVNIGPTVSGWQVLRRKLLRRSPAKVPSIAATILRASALNGAYQLAGSERLADLAINPPVDQFGILDFSAYQAVMDIGYETARREIAAWQERMTESTSIQAAASSTEPFNCLRPIVSGGPA